MKGKKLLLTKRTRIGDKHDDYVLCIGTVYEIPYLMKGSRLVMNCLEDSDLNLKLGKVVDFLEEDSKLIVTTSSTELVFEIF